MGQIEIIIENRIKKQKISILNYNTNSGIAIHYIENTHFIAANIFQIEQKI